jgi:hypothetical protein
VDDQTNAKLDKISSDISEINITLVKQQASLDVHIKRTDQLEDMVLPLNTLRTEVKGVVKLVYFLSALAALLEVVRLLK